MENKKMIKKKKTGGKVWVVVVVSVLLAGALAGAGVYLWQKTLCRTEKKGINDQVATLQDNLATCEAEIDRVLTIPQKPDEDTPLSEENEVKEISLLGGFVASLPTSWSVTEIPESVGTDVPADFPSVSVSPNYVSFGDSHAGQIDFYYLQDDVGDARVENEKNREGVETTWTTEDIAGFEAQVAKYDAGQDTKAAGGKRYFVKLDGVDVSGFEVKTLEINVQGGDNSTEYQKELEAFLKSIKR